MASDATGARTSINVSEFGELLSATAGSFGDDADDVEANRLRQRPALADDDGVALLAAKTGRDVRRDIPVALLITTRTSGDVRRRPGRSPLVFLDVVEVVSAHDDRPTHLRRLHLSWTARGDHRSHIRAAPCLTGFGRGWRRRL